MKKMISLIKNYWYYYKVYVITGVLVLAVVIYSFANSGEGETYGHYVAVISSTQYTEEQLNTLQQAFTAEYGSCGVKTYQVTLGALNQDEAVLAKLDLDLGQKLSDFLLVEDIDAFRESISSDIKLSEPVSAADVPYLAGLGFDALVLVTRE